MDRHGLLLMSSSRLLLTAAVLVVHHHHCSREGKLLGRRLDGSMRTSTHTDLILDGKENIIGLVPSMIASNARK